MRGAEVRIRPPSAHLRRYCHFPGSSPQGHGSHPLTFLASPTGLRPPPEAKPLLCPRGPRAGRWEQGIRGPEAATPGPRRPLMGMRRRRSTSAFETQLLRGGPPCSLSALPEPASRSLRSPFMPSHRPQPPLRTQTRRHAPQGPDTTYQLGWPSGASSLAEMSARAPAARAVSTRARRHRGGDARARGLALRPLPGRSGKASSLRRRCPGRQGAERHPEARSEWLGGHLKPQAEQG